MGKFTKISLSILIFFASFLKPAAISPQEEATESLKDQNQAVVSIIAFDDKKKEIVQGKGVILSSDGLVLTNYHIISQARSAKARIPEGKKIKKSADLSDIWSMDNIVQTRSFSEKKGKQVDVQGIVSFDKTLDLALIKIKGSNYTTAQLASSDVFEIGNKALIVVDEETVSEGTITGVNDLIENKKIAQINLPFPPEMSGAPVFNTQAEVVGIISHLVQKSKIILPASYATPLMEKKAVTPFSKFDQEDYFVISEGLFLRGMVHSIMGNYTQSSRLLEEALQLNANNPDALAQLGFNYSRLRQYDKAADILGKAVSQNPQDFRSYFGLGEAQMRLNDHQQAITSFTQCTQINPDFPDAFFNLGIAYETMSQLEKAAEAYEKFIKINPGPAWTGLNQVGTIYAKLGQYDKAVTAFQEVVKINPSDVKATYNLGYSLEMSGQYAQAAPLYRKLTELNPKDSKSYLSLLFRLWDKAENLDKAAEVGQEIIAQSPDNPQDYYNLGIIYFKKDDHAKALESFNQALAINPKFEQAFYNIGLVHFKQKKYAEAAAAFTKFTEINPNNADAFYNIGAGYLQIKKYEQALKPLQKAVELRPDYALAHYNLGIVYYLLEDRFSAQEEYKTLLKLDPSLAERLRKVLNR